MHIIFLNPQGNFDTADSHWTQHPDFGGQLVYVKETALAMAAQGHRIDIVTRRIVDPAWPQFSSEFDSYDGHPNVRIVRIACGGDAFLAKEELWPYLVREWVPNIEAFYRGEGRLPDGTTTHYGDGGLAGALLEARTGVPFTFTGHSLGAQKLDKLLGDKPPDDASLAPLEERFHFAQRLAGERLAMNRAGKVITSTREERFEQYGHPAYRAAVDPDDDRKFSVIPPGVNLAVFDATSRNDREQATADFLETVIARDISADRRGLPIILLSSRVDHKKNHIALLRAFAGHPELQAMANVGIVVRGADNALQQRSRFSGEARELLDQMAALCDEAGLWGKVTAFPLEGQAELAAAYRYLTGRHSLFCLPAFHEPFGLAPLEAMAAGLPAVVTKNGGPSESLYENGASFGVLIDPADPDDIARGVSQVLESPQAWQRYSEAGRGRVLARYTWDRTAAGYAAVLEEIIARGPGDQTGQRLPIPPYFRQPDPANDFTTADLAAIYTGRM
ncbi:MAG: glycosyltransferase [Caldilineae bacterium]|nr:glycosyltransferase [Caldilineae bacterium]